MGQPVLPGGPIFLTFLYPSPQMKNTHTHTQNKQTNKKHNKVGWWWQLPLMVSSKTLLQSLAVTDVEASILGLELISISHGWRSSVSMKSAPYSSNDDCNNPQSLDTVWKHTYNTFSSRHLF